MFDEPMMGWIVILFVWAAAAMIKITWLENRIEKLEQSIGRKP